MQVLGESIKSRLVNKSCLNVVAQNAMVFFSDVSDLGMHTSCRLMSHFHQDTRITSTSKRCLAETES